MLFSSPSEAESSLDWPPAGLLTCASSRSDSPSRNEFQWLWTNCRSLRAYSYGVATDSHRLPNTGLRKGYPAAGQGSNFDNLATFRRRDIEPNSAMLRNL